MSDFAFVGTEGCGKTVLITALSRLYGPTSDQQLQLNPVNRQTAQYVERAWQALKQSEWPPSTPPGQWASLEWHCHFTSGYRGRMRLLDSAGQDLRQLFAEDQVSKLAELPGPLQTLANEIASARAVAFLVNLADFEGEKDSDKRLANEWLLRGAMDYRERVCPGAPKCLVFTQSDLYRSQLSGPDALRKVAFQRLPLVAGMYLQDGTVPLFAVSAVGKTINVPDETGSPRRVPPRKLSCSGFGALVEWMESCTRVQQASASTHQWAGSQASQPNSVWPTMSTQQAASSPTPASSTRGHRPSASRQWPNITDADVSKIAWGIFIFIAIFILPMIRSCNERAKQKEKENVDKLFKDIRGR